MSIFLIADTHFGHGNIMKYCKRYQFMTEAEVRLLREGHRDLRIASASVQAMDDYLIAEINRVVGEEDVLWHLGDFAWGRYEEVRRYRDRIRCRTINLVWGNHDRAAVRNLFHKTMEQGLITVEGQPIFLNHYPMLSWNRDFHGAWHCYGHVHGRLKRFDDADPKRLALDVGVDRECRYRPWSMEELRAYMAPRVARWQEWKARRSRGEAEEEAEEGPIEN
jgi:calcineurin-like phosphoesterase family protein